MMRKRLITMLLVLGCLSSVFIACSSDSDIRNGESGMTDKTTDSDETKSADADEPDATDTTDISGQTPDDDPEPVEPKVTIACIGDSITEGIGVDEADRNRYSYPARLAEALGDKYEVINYGKAGATMCSSSAKLYESKSWFTFSGRYDELKSRAADIDIAFIMLGTNDGNTSVEQINTLISENVEAFKADYTANLTQMVNDLRSGNRDVRIYLMTSPKCFRTGNTWEQTLAEVVRPLQKELAAALGIELYDMYTFTADTVTQKGFPDNLHPGKTGYYLIGRALAKTVAGIYGTELLPGELSDALSFEENFDTVEDGTAFTQQEDVTVTIGNTKFKIRAKENSSVTVNDGILALTRSGTNTDAFIDVLLGDSVTSGKYTFEISLKASENFNSRGAIFYIFGYQFLKYTVAGDITDNAGTTVGKLPSDRFMKITLTVDSETEAYIIFIDDVKVSEGTFTFKEVNTFRPIQFFANGESTLYLDYIKAFSTEG